MSRQINFCKPHFFVYFLFLFFFLSFKQSYLFAVQFSIYLFVSLSFLLFVRFFMYFPSEDLSIDHIYLLYIILTAFHPPPISYFLCTSSWLSFTLSFPPFPLNPPSIIFSLPGQCYLSLTLPPSFPFSILILLSLTPSFYPSSPSSSLPPLPILLHVNSLPHHPSFIPSLFFHPSIPHALILSLLSPSSSLPPLPILEHVNSLPHPP